MPAYNFQKQFVPMIIDGQKPHTIRKRRVRRPTVAGDRLFLYTGMRTKNSELIANALCTLVEPVIIYPFIGHIRKNGVLMEENEIEALAKADGFQDAELFFDFFRKTYDKTELNDFEIIHWDVASMKKAVRDGELFESSKMSEVGEGHGFYFCISL